MVSQNLSGKKILIGVSGGIAAYKIQFLVRALRRGGAEVRVMLTAHAEHFVTPLSMEALSGNPVYSRLFASRDNYAHISLREWADLFILAPLTANLAGKLANGIADDLISTTALGWEKPGLLCPAMNEAMYRAPVVQRNLSLLKQDGWHILGPGAGDLACGTSGQGRMVEPEEIVAVADKLSAPVDRHPGKIVITAGACRQPIDPVRFISNRSTGKMGAALAHAAVARFDRVTVVCAAMQAELPTGVVRVDVETAGEMLEALRRELADADALVMAAAVADFQVEAPAASKIKKEKNSSLHLVLLPAPDILKETAQQRRSRGVVSVGFAMETEQLVENAARKLTEKALDGIVANPLDDPEAGFGVDTNRVHFLTPSDGDAPAVESWPVMSKRDVGAAVIDRVVEMMEA